MLSLSICSFSVLLMLFDMCTFFSLHLFSSVQLLFLISELSSHYAYCSFTFLQFNSFFGQNNQLCIVISYLLLFTHTSATEFPTDQESWINFANWIVTDQLTVRWNSSPPIIFEFTCTIGLQETKCPSHFVFQQFMISHVANSCCEASRLSKLQSLKWIQINGPKNFII